MTEFEKGALFALQTLKGVVENRRGALNRAEGITDGREGRDLYQVFNAMGNVLSGVQSEFESTLLPRLRDEQKREPSAETHDLLLAALVSIREQSTRRTRASQNKQYLLTDLEIITYEAKKAIELLEKM